MSEELTTTEGMALSLLPYYLEGGKKSRYLGYVVAGFSTTEAMKLAKVHPATVRRWREEDETFLGLERQAGGELRERLANTLVDIEYTRNFRLVLAKDFNILYKDATDQKLTDREQQYLLLIRKFYTPQQLAMVRQLLSGNGQSSEAFDFTRTVLEIRLSKETQSAK